MRILFLDFDGVTHPEDAGDFSPSGNTLEIVGVRDDTPLFCRLPLLADALREHADVKIVLSTSWRRLFTPDELLERLGELGDRYVGNTPFLNGCNRYAEALEYLRQRGQEYVPWIALEDDRRNFPEEAPVVWCDSNTGLDEATIQQLRAWLEATRCG